MNASIPNSPRSGSSDFHKIVAAFLAGDGLPFAEILSCERIERIFKKHNGLFGMGSIFSTAVVVWAFLSQALRDGKEASCQAAIACIVSDRRQHGLNVPTSDTGNYCRARAKLSVEAIRELSSEIAEELEQAAEAEWLWKGKHHAKLVDGFTFTMHDTPSNQAMYPQQKSQKPGVGLPIARAAVITSLATACVIDVAIAPYQGKKTGETALLRSMLDSFAPGDIAVMDRYYCSFMMIALLFNQGTHVCARKHHLRRSDFRRGKRLGKYDHLIVWTRPVCPDWMDEALYETIPKELVLREIRFNVVVPGRRTATIDIITTLTDAEEYTKEDLAELYGFRWNSELDIRCVKSYLNLDHLRCKSPPMVHRELWMTILAYNLIRTTAAAAALLHAKQPRQISFTSTCQYVLASWMQLSGRLMNESEIEGYLLIMLQQIASCEVANRPGRLEPRVVKRRLQRYKLMTKPRKELQAELRNQHN